MGRDPHWPAGLAQQLGGNDAVPAIIARAGQGAVWRITARATARPAAAISASALPARASARAISAGVSSSCIEIRGLSVAVRLIALT
jgi:hypothetical protein